jgi:hypothetical protein
MSARVKVTRQGFKCERCGYIWIGRKSDPKRCASCRSPRWQIKPRAYRRKETK